MANFLANLPVIANGTINPSVFVMGDPSRNSAVLQAVGVTGFPVGVSQAGTKAAPGLLAALGSTAPTTQPAAVAGDSIGIYTAGDVCGLTVGSVAVTAWDKLTFDGNAGAIPQSSGTWGAIALESGTVGQIIQVLVAYGKA